MTATTRVACYLRQSKDVADDKLGIERQREACLKLCADRGWSLIEFYKDNNRSASNGKLREDYQRLLADIAANKVDVVVAYHQDRIGRDVLEIIAFGALVVAHDVKVTTVSGGPIDFGSDDGEFVSIIGAAVAAKETKRKGARQKLAAKQKAEGGQNAWATRPFGYVVRVPMLDENGHPMLTAKGKPVWAKPTLDPVEAEAVKAAYKSLLAGSSLRSIAGDLDRAGLVTPRGNRWRTSSQVRQMLQSARYAGLRTYNGEEVREGDWPAIVPRDIWEDAQLTLSDPSRLCGESRARRHMLSNLVICGGMIDAKGKSTTDPAKIVGPCGSKMGSGISGRAKPILVCRNCNGVSRDMASLDNLVIEAVTQRLSQPDAIELTHPEQRDDLAAKRDEARTLRARLDEIADERADGLLTGAQAKRATDRVTEKLAAIEADLRAARVSHTFDGLIDVGDADDVRGVFLSLDLDRRRAVVSELLKITVLPTVKGARFRREDVRVEFTSDTP